MVATIQENPKIYEEPEKKPEGFQYINKFKTAIYGFILFIILSNKVFYKILDIIVKLFTNNTHILDDDNETPTIYATFIGGIIMFVVLFIF